MARLKKRAHFTEVERKPQQPQVNQMNNCTLTLTLTQAMCCNLSNSFYVVATTPRTFQTNANDTLANAATIHLRRRHRTTLNTHPIPTWIPQ